MANSSHLEAIDPAIVGRVRAEQVEKGDSKCMYIDANLRIYNFLIDDNRLPQIS